MTRIDNLVALAGRAEANRMAPTGSRGWFRMSKSATDAVIHVYDSIGGYDGISASDFVSELHALEAKSITVHINSGGGDVFDAIAMHAALVNHPATVSTVVDGIAASAASFLAMAGETVSIEKPARMMIHDAAGLTIGNQADHLEMGKLLGEISDTIAGMYSDRSGGPAADWRKAMQAETWYTSSQAVESGLADKVLNDEQSTDAVQDRRSQMIRARARVTLKG